eukprot:2349000-Rhodomonas_salina.1
MSLKPLPVLPSISCHAPAEHYSQAKRERHRLSRGLMRCESRQDVESKSRRVSTPQVRRGQDKTGQDRKRAERKRERKGSEKKEGPARKTALTPSRRRQCRSRAQPQRMARS